MAPTLRQVQWPPKFKPEMPPRYDGAADPVAFLLAYEEAVLKAGGDNKVMANWLPMALTGVPRAWLLHLPGSSVASWGELRDLFIARFGGPAPPSPQPSLVAHKRRPRTVIPSRSFARSAPPPCGRGLPQVGWRPRPT